MSFRCPAKHCFVADERQHDATDRAGSACENRSRSDFSGQKASGAVVFIPFREQRMRPEPGENSPGTSWKLAENEPGTLGKEGRFERKSAENGTFFEKSTILIEISLDKCGKRVYSNCIR